MNYELRLKTDAYETSSYYLVIRLNQIILIPVFPSVNKDCYVVNSNEIVNITVEVDTAKLVIRTKEMVLDGVLITAGDVNSLYAELRTELLADIKCVSHFSENIVV